MAKSKPASKAPARPASGGSYVRRDGKLFPPEPEKQAEPAPPAASENEGK